MKDEEFAFNLGGLLGFCIGFFPGFLAGISIPSLAWRSLFCCILFSLVAKFGTRIIHRMLAVSAAPMIEELGEPPQLEATEETEVSPKGKESLGANA